jgi:hypothetical protein
MCPTCTIGTQENQKGTKRTIKGVSTCEALNVLVYEGGEHLGLQEGGEEGEVGLHLLRQEGNLNLQRCYLQNFPKTFFTFGLPLSYVTYLDFITVCSFLSCNKTLAFGSAYPLLRLFYYCQQERGVCYFFCL